MSYNLWGLNFSVFFLILLCVFLGLFFFFNNNNNNNKNFRPEVQQGPQFTSFTKFFLIS